MQKTISARVPATEKNGLGEDVRGSVNYTFPDSVEEYVGKFGEKVALSILEQHTTVKLQAMLRAHMVSKDAEGVLSPTGTDLQPFADKYIPGMARPKMSAVDKAVKATADMSDEEFKDYIQKVKQQRAG